MGANYAPFVADLFLVCYESEFMKNLSKSNDLNLIEKFKNTYRYLDDLCLLDNTLFQTNITTIYPKELILLQSTSSGDKATFLDLDIQIHNLHCTIKIYDKRDDFVWILSIVLALMARFHQAHRMEHTYLNSLELQEYATRLKI